MRTRPRSARIRVEGLEDRLVLSELLPGYTEETVVTGLARPTAMDLAPDGRIFVAEQGGTLRVIKGDRLLATPFLSLNVDSAGERGLLGVTFDPDFARNGFVYVYYTVPGSPAHNRVSRFTAAGDVAAPGSEVPILDLDPLSAARNHNGGAIHFAPDGTLLVAVGENARPELSQSLDSRLGKILRIYPDGSIPVVNPFYDTATDQNRAIWALGLRNPYTFAVDPAGTADNYRIFINDVGQSTWEEVNVGVPGGNYGWPRVEGPSTLAGFITPTIRYRHEGSPTACAISGGAFGSLINTASGSPARPAYFYADYCASFIRAYGLDNGNTSSFATGLPIGVVDLDVVPGLGDLLYLARGDGPTGGVVGRITGDVPPVFDGPVDIPPAIVGRHLTLTNPGFASLSPVALQWQRNGVDIPGATGPIFTIPAVRPEDVGARYRLVATNRAGTTASPEGTLIAGSPYVRGLALDLLGREADAGLITTASRFLAGGGDPADLATAFVVSREARARSIASLYEDLLSRPAGVGEVAYWTSLLEAGATFGDVRLAVLSSAEYVARAGGSPPAIARSLFQDLFGRGPSAPELDAAVNAIGAGLYGAMAQHLSRAFEVMTHEVTDWYARYLRRTAAPGEIVGWVDLLSAGIPRDRVLGQFLATPEYQAVTARLFS